MSVGPRILGYFGLATVAAVSGCAATDADTTDTSSAALRYCPVTDPNYPACVPEPDGCSGATGTLTATPATVNAGQSATLRWNFRAPATCSAAFTLDNQVVGRTGSKVVTPMSSSPFRLRLGTEQLAVANVNVVLPSTVRINGSTPDWKRLLVQAVGTPNTRVVLANDVDMDMAGYHDIYVRQGVTLTSEAPPPPQSPSFSAGVFPDPALLPPAARNARNLGPRLYTNERPRPLFRIQCDDRQWGDNARFIGFRLRGPHPDTEEGAENEERGIQVISCIGVEIANMEVSGFSGAAIYVEDPERRQLTEADALRVHDSYIHNNQHHGGFGYGVQAGVQGFAKIERNVFDQNRHAIAANGAAYTRYIADHNLVLKGGGLHDRWYKTYTHQFDVHGDHTCVTPYDCGNAGGGFTISNNAFQYSNERAIKIRGVPRQLSTITHDVFAHENLGDAVATGGLQIVLGHTNVSMGPNTVGADTYGEYGICDIDGDGKDDLFLATGASWWYASGGKMNWVYLNSHRERLSKVGLGDFDGDGRCDVFAVNASTGAFEISRGGSAPWTALPGTYSVPFDQLAFGDFNGDKVMDVFRRAPDGQWSAVSPGRWGWTTLQSSSQALQDLRFGDFNGDGVTDVLGRSNGTWAVSLGGSSAWQPWNTLSDSATRLLIGNVDGIPGDDILRYVSTGPLTGRWDISSGGRTAWKTFVSAAFPSVASLWPSAATRSFVGRFEGFAGADLLAIDVDRRSSLFSLRHPDFIPHGLYAH